MVGRGLWRFSMVQSKDIDVSWFDSVVEDFSAVHSQSLSRMGSNKYQIYLCIFS